MYTSFQSLTSRVHEFTPIAQTLQGTIVIPAHPTVDPFIDHCRWYLGSEYTNDIRISDQDINARLWEYTTFRDQVESLPGIVLLQRFDSAMNSANTGGWRLAFSDGEARHRLFEWFNSLVKEYRIETPMTGPQFSEMEAWVREHIKGPHYINSSWSNSTKNVVAMIKSLHEAMEFKMRWYKIEKPEEEDA